MRNQVVVQVQSQVMTSHLTGTTWALTSLRVETSLLLATWLDYVRDDSK